MEEVNLSVKNNSSNKRNTWMWVGITIIIVLVIIFLVVIIAESGESVELDVSETKMEIEYSDYLGYTATITGIAKNVTNRDFSYASIEFSVYDSEGNNMGTAFANINNLAAGDTWRFEASFFDFSETKPVSYKLIEIITW